MEGNNGESNKIIVQIMVDKDGNLSVNTKLKTKELVVGALADSLKIVAMTKDNVVNVPLNLSPGGVRNWINRKMGKR